MNIFRGIFCQTFFLIATAATAGEFDQAVDQQFRVTRFSDNQIQVEIDQTMKIACRGDRCELASITQKGESFTIGLQAGVGNRQASSSNGSVVIVDPNGSNTDANNSGPYIGLTLKYLRGNCTQVVNVPRSLYRAMNTYLYHLIQEDGSTERQFSPAQQTMILFYTTILNKASGCTIPQ